MARTTKKVSDMTNNIVTVTLDQVDNILKLHSMANRSASKKKQTPPIMFHSSPGVGKTQKINEYYSKPTAKFPEGRTVHTWILSLLDPTDIKGIPAADKSDPKKWVTKWLISNYLANVQPNDVIFVDEISRATELVRASFLTLFQDRKLGDFILPEGVDIIAAMNDSDIGVMKMSAAMNNRFTHYYLVSDAQSWAKEYAPEAGVHVHWQAFITSNPQHLDDFQRDQAAFPSPRSIENASILLTEAEELIKSGEISKEDSKFLIESALTGTIGKGVTLEFLAFRRDLENAKECNLPAILANPTGVDIPKRDDLKYATCLGLAHIADRTNLDAIYTYIKRYEKKEFQVLCFSSLLKKHPELYTHSAVSKFNHQHGNVVAG